MTINFLQQDIGLPPSACVCVSVWLTADGMQTYLIIHDYKDNIRLLQLPHRSRDKTWSPGSAEFSGVKLKVSFRFLWRVSSVLPTFKVEFSIPQLWCKFLPPLLMVTPLTSVCVASQHTNVLWSHLCGRILLPEWCPHWKKNRRNTAVNFRPGFSRCPA